MKAALASVPPALWLGVGVGLVAVVGVALVGRKAVQLAKENAHLVNPADSRNVVYEGIVGSVGRTVSQDESWSLGKWFWELTHAEQVKKETQVTGGGLNSSL